MPKPTAPPCAPIWHRRNNKQLLLTYAPCFSEICLLQCSILQAIEKCSLLCQNPSRCPSSTNTFLVQSTSDTHYNISQVYFPVDSTVKQINLLKPSGFFTYRQVKNSEILHGARFALSVLYGSQNRQRPLLYTSLTDWFL